MKIFANLDNIMIQTTINVWGQFLNVQSDWISMLASLDVNAHREKTTVMLQKKKNAKSFVSRIKRTTTTQEDAFLEIEKFKRFYIVFI